MRAAPGVLAANRATSTLEIKYVDTIRHRPVEVAAAEMSLRLLEQDPSQSNDDRETHSARRDHAAATLAVTKPDPDYWEQQGSEHDLHGIEIQYFSQPTLCNSFSTCRIQEPQPRPVRS